MSTKRSGEQDRRQPEQRDDEPVSQPTDEVASLRPSFEQLVERALDGLPERFKVLLEDVAIVIDDLPSRDQLGYAGSPTDGWLYGLYEGVPATEYGADWAPIPNKITLFQVPLETDFPDPDELADEVQRTVIHELAHHAGIDDDRLHELDYD